jgi:hypothetical protein
MLYASMLGVTITGAKMEARGTWGTTGSAFQQTRASHFHKLQTTLELASDSDPKLVAAVLRNASNGCHAEQAFRNPVPIEEQVLVNGEAFAIEAYPAEPIRRHASA